MAERRGLSVPSDPGVELQRMMQEEQAQEDRKEVSQEDIFAPSLEDRKEDVFTTSKEGGKERTRTGRKETSTLGRREDWKEAVKTRAKTGSGEGRKVRLNVEIPAPMHLELKMYCLREGFNLNEIVPALIATFMEGNG